MAKLHIRPDVVKGHINPEIQGHFSEHLGRCIQVFTQEKILRFRTQTE